VDATCRWNLLIALVKRGLSLHRLESKICALVNANPTIAMTWFPTVFRSSS
jgi:hypothetical protein